MNSSQSTITTVILAGGAARRMGGEDKGLTLLNGQPMIRHVIDRIAPQSSQIIINCNRSQSAYGKLGYPLVEDSMRGGLGPLAGILSAMEISDSDYILSVPCDTPQLPHELVTRMLSTLKEQNAEACTVSDGDRLHPVVLLLKRELLPKLKTYLNYGGRKVHDWFYSLRHCHADFSDQPEAFVNINTPQQLESLQQRVANDHG